MKEHQTQSKLIFHGVCFDVYDDKIQTEDGKDGIRQYLKHNGGAAVLYVENEKVLLVKQYRYSYQEETIEIPAGKIEIGEPPEKTALRELKEETGVSVDSLQKIFTFYPTPGYTNEKISIFYAENGAHGETHFDEDESLNSAYYSLSDVQKMLDDGTIKDGKTIVALQWLLLKKR